MDPHVRRDVVPLRGGEAAAGPATRQVQIARLLAPDVLFVDVLEQRAGVGIGVGAEAPVAGVGG